MTVTYTGSVSNSSIIAFLSALFRWRASVWKAVWVELLAWCLAYTVLSVCYRTAMNKQQQYNFEDVCVLCYKYSELLPLTFLLGFYVTQVVNRWQTMFGNLGWCDNFSLYVAAYMAGKDERTRMMKRSIARYMTLLQILVYRDISIKIRKRFPTMDTLITAGVLTETERDLLNAATGSHSKYYMPAMWAMQVVRTARDEGRIKSDFAVSDIYNHILILWNRQFTLVLFDWVPIPLVYTQVVFVTVRIYFLIALLGRQYIISNRYDDNGYSLSIDAYVPIFTIFQFIFYMGWLRVAEALLNPFGEDDDDYECNWIIDRNMATAMKIVDSTEGKEADPRYLKDQFWDTPNPTPMYSTLTVPDNRVEPQGSAVAGVKIPKSPVVMVPRVENSHKQSRTSVFRSSIANLTSSINKFRSLNTVSSPNVNDDTTVKIEGGERPPLSHSVACFPKPEILHTRPSRDQRSKSESESFPVRNLHFLRQSPRLSISNATLRQFDSV